MDRAVQHPDLADDTAILNQVRAELTLTEADPATRETLDSESSKPAAASPRESDRKPRNGLRDLLRRFASAGNSASSAEAKDPPEP